MTPDFINWPLEQAISWAQQTVFYRADDLAISELDDPAKPGRPLILMGGLAGLEERWPFLKDGVPPYMRFYTQEPARAKLLLDICFQYTLPPSERKKPSGIPIDFDPDFQCLILNEADKIIFNGHRADALADPVIRPFYFMDGARIFNGADALERLSEIRGGGD
jgi:hypothetical protein